MRNHLPRFPLTLLVATVCCLAQTDKSPRFEVASIKSVGVDVRMEYTEDGSQASYARLPLTNYISEAYRVGLDQISGPDWLSTDFFAVTVKLPPGTTKEQRPQMMANLLAERFGLVVHRTTRQVNGYEITVAPGGAKLTPSAPEVPAAAPRTGNFEMPMPDANGFPILPPGSRWAGQNTGGMMRMTFRQATMGFLANRLRAILSGTETVPVTDKTSITGQFDFHLEIPAQPRRLPAKLQLRFGQAMTTNADDPDVGPKNISADLEKQLGLKLNPVKTSLEFIVVDHCNKLPTDN